MFFRSSQLKVLNLGPRFSALECDFINACKRFPLLEILDTVTTSFTEVGIESIGRSCRNLKIFGFCNYFRIQWPYETNNSLALAIAKNMSGLQKLKISEDQLDDDGLVAIFEGCPNLEFLCIHNCPNLMLGEKHKKMMDKVRVKYFSFRRNEFVNYDSKFEDESFNNSCFENPFNNLLMY